MISEKRCPISSWHQIRRLIEDFGALAMLLSRITPQNLPCEHFASALKSEIKIFKCWFIFPVSIYKYTVYTPKRKANSHAKCRKCKQPPAQAIGNRSQNGEVVQAQKQGIVTPIAKTEMKQISKIEQKTSHVALFAHEKLALLGLSWIALPET